MLGVGEGENIKTSLKIQGEELKVYHDEDDLNIIRRSIPGMNG